MIVLPRPLLKWSSSNRSPNPGKQFGDILVKKSKSFDAAFDESAPSASTPNISNQRSDISDQEPVISNHPKHK